MASKQRLDMVLVSRGLVKSRAEAQALIMAGKVLIGDQRITKPGHSVPEDADIRLEGKEHPWVSRGGMKLAKGLDEFGVNPQGMVCVDVGASTGGFTDVLLTHGAAKVYAVDVGHGQLDWKLRNDPRVVVLEKTNARHLTVEHVPERIDMIVCDASFISLQTVLPAVMRLAQGHSHLIALIKPQFEVGKDQIGKGGVVRDTSLHEQVCNDIARWMQEDMGWQVHGVTESPITGPKGNKEFLMYATA